MLGTVTGNRPAGAGTLAVNEANHRDPVMTSHMNDRKPGSVTIESLEMTKRGRVPAKRGTGAVTAGSGQAAGPVGPVRPARFGIVVDRVVPAYLACRIGARARAGDRDAWAAVAAIALGSFALVFSEVIRAGCSRISAGTWACRSGPAG
jgi:hypothetical protein